MRPVWQAGAGPHAHHANNTKKARPQGSDLFRMVRVTGFEPAASWSQTTRATSCATPGWRQKKLAALRFRGLRKCRENCVSAPSFFRSKSKRGALIWETGREETRCTPFPRQAAGPYTESRRKAKTVYRIFGAAARGKCGGREFLRKSKDVHVF